MNNFLQLRGFERRWATAMVGSFAPAGGPGLAPSLGQVDYVGAFELMCRSTTRLAALGLRVALWMSVLAPMLVWGRATTALSLSAERRGVLLGEMLTHRFMIVRELTLLLKLCASFAIFRVSALRVRSHYEDAQRAHDGADRAHEDAQRAHEGAERGDDGAGSPGTSPLVRDEREESGERARVRLPMMAAAAQQSVKEVA